MVDIYEIAFKILSVINEHDLPNMCLTSKLNRRILNDEYFWRKRYMNDDRLSLQRQINFKLPVIPNFSDYYRLYNREIRMTQRLEKMISEIKGKRWDLNEYLWIHLMDLKYSQLSYLLLDTKMLCTLYRKGTEEINENGEEDPVRYIFFSYHNDNFYALLVISDPYGLEDDEVPQKFILTKEKLFKILYNLIYINISFYDQNHNEYLI